MPSSKPLSGKTCVLTPAVAGRCSMLRPCCPLASNVPSGTPGLLARDKVGALAETNIVAQRSRCMLRLASDFPNSLRRVTLSCRISATGCFERVPTALRDQWSGGEGTGSSSGSHELDPSSRVVIMYQPRYTARNAQAVQASTEPENSCAHGEVECADLRCSTDRRARLRQHT
eukprot:6173591-Pleurochrysis_carterae.AAC.4